MKNIKGYCHEFDASSTGWTNVNLLYLPDSIKIASLEGLTLWCQEINQSNSCWHSDARFSWLEDNDLQPRCRHCLFLTYSYRDNLIFFTFYFSAISLNKNDNKKQTSRSFSILFSVMGSLEIAL